MPRGLIWLPAMPPEESWSPQWWRRAGRLPRCVRLVSSAPEAAQALEQGRQQAAEHYVAAHRLLSQRSAGEECAAASSVIDQELGL